MSPKLYIVYLEWTSKHRDEANAILKSFTDRVFNGYQINTVIIDNSTSVHLEVELDWFTNWTSGNNRYREFSGWQKGIDFFASNETLEPESPILFVNDTFHRSYGTDYLELFDAARVQRALNANKLVGYVDGYPAEAELFGLKFNSWVRTSFFLMNYRTLQTIGVLPCIFDEEKVFSNSIEEFFAPDAPLSKNYQTYLKTWLFGDFRPEDEFKEAWHSQEKLSKTNMHFMRGKATAIFCEHYLSARARKFDIGIEDVRRTS